MEVLEVPAIVEDLEVLGAPAIVEAYRIALAVEALVFVVVPIASVIGAWAAVPQIAALLVVSVEAEQTAVLVAVLQA